jgi:glucokinase
MYFLFDIGGTNMRGACADATSILRTKVVPTPSDYTSAIDTLVDLSRELSKGASYSLSAGGIAGMFTREKDALLLAPNLPDWVGRPLKQTLKKELGTEVLLENDSALGGLGEAVEGSGKGYRIVMYYGIGTGVGGVRIVDRKIDVATYGFEPGHMMLEEDRTLEELISGNGIFKSEGKMPQEIKDSLFWEKVTRHLATGIYNSILHWSPNVVVLGGGIIEQGMIQLDDVHKYLDTKLSYLPQIPALVKAQFPGESGLYGAYALLKSK